jgi:copper chaperone CopZ
MNRGVIQIEGMTCEGCTALVAEAIRNTPGVLAVEVDYKSGEATVGSDICCPFPRDEILASIRAAGYSGH